MKTKRHLVVGLCLLMLLSILFLCTTCRKMTTYIHNYEFVYVNKTDFTLKFEVSNELLNYRYLVILPQSSSSIEIQLGGGKNAAGDRDQQFVLECYVLGYDSYGLNRTKRIVFIDETSCVEFLAAGFADISNYQCKVHNKQHLEYTYIFTDADFIDVKSCVE